MRPLDPQYVVEDRGYKSPCLIWQGATHRGYGKLKSGGKTVLAHRYFYEQHEGPIPLGKDLDHLCRQRPCVNHEHLEPVDRGVNTQRGLLAKLSPEKVALVRADCRPLTALAPLLGVHPATLCKVRHGSAWANIAGTASVGKRRYRPLTLEQDGEIRRRAAAGETFRSIGRCLDIDGKTVSYVVKHKKS